MYESNYNYESYMNYVYDIVEQAIDVIEQNCNIIYTAGILSILKRFAHNNDYVTEFIDSHRNFYERSKLAFRKSLSDFGRRLLEKKFDQDFFLYSISKAKADFSRVENDFLNHTMSTIFSKNMVDTYGFACYIASISNINIDDESLAWNDGTALAFALTGSAEFTKYDAGKISEVVEVNVVNIFYTLIDIINNHDISMPEPPKPHNYVPTVKPVDIINEDILKEILEDDEIEDENLG